MAEATTAVRRGPGEAVRRRSGTARPELPPGPPLPTLVQSAIWGRRAKQLSYACQDRYGDMFTIRIVYEAPWVMLADHELVKQVFKGDPRVFHAGEGNEVFRPFLGTNSLLTLDEQPHLRQRRLLLPPFHGERIKGYADVMSEVAAREMETWPTGAPHKLRPRMQALTLEIILRTVFGVDQVERLGPLRGAVRRFLDLTTDPKQIIPLIVLGPNRVRHLPYFRRTMEAVDSLIYTEIEERRRAADLGEREDILSLLISARHEGESPMSDEEIRDELLTLLVAGHETTATSLSWALERLAHDPERLERLRDEVLAGSDRYLTATIQETLRLRPVLPIVIRRLTQPLEIGGYELPAGVSVTPNIYLVHRDPRTYPEPDRFLPERFLDSPPGTYTWIPFGGGVRRCLGASFAQFEMAVVLKELVRRYSEIRPARPKPERIFRRAITETPRHNAELILA